jgi:ATP phosphoribosyltransferase regulatory subunit
MDELPAPHPALLPAGLRDLLPPDAQVEAASVETLMAVFASHGYARVKPPMLEFEENLLAGTGAAVADQTFRIMDPASHRMMALRADITPQVARIAATRLANSPRPLRLSYTGECIRTGGQRDTDRQLPQAGIELIGADNAAADAEAMLVAAEALAALGLARLSLDLTLPTLTPALLDGAGVSGTRRIALARALDRKDAAGVIEHGGALAAMLTDLLRAAGPAQGALAALARAPLTPPLRALAERLQLVTDLLHAQAPQLRLTIDPVEFRGFRYHTGIAVAVYAPGRHEELGRGGRYLSLDAEPATGLTLYADAVLRAAPARPARRSVFIPVGTDPGIARGLRADNFATLAALGPCDPETEARRLHCTHVLRDGSPHPVSPGEAGQHG